MFRIFFVACLAVSLASADDVKPDAPKSTATIPDIASQRAARSRINGTFADEIAKAKKPGDKAEVARKLLQTADETSNDAPVKYVALTMARELAVSDGDADTAIAAITGLEAYAIDSLKLKADTLTALMKSTGSPHDFLVGSVVEQAINENRYPIARQLVDTSLFTAKSAGDAIAISNANEWLQEIKEIEAASGAVSKATTLLLITPGDPVASLTVGRFEAFLKNRWDKGVPLLASGSDASLKSLAQLELAAANDPTKQMQVAEGWWGIGAKERGLARSHIREHAAHWYKLALPTLGGLEKAMAQKRVKESAVVRPIYTGWIDLLRKVKIERDATKGTWTFERGALTAGPRADIKIAPKPGKTYQLRVEFAFSTAAESGATCGIMLPVADTQVVLSITPIRLGLDIVDGKRWFNGDTIKKGDFGGAGKKHVAEVTVSQDAPEAKILVFVDGKQQLEWIGEPSRLTNAGDWNLQPPALGIGTWDQPIAIYGIALRECDPEPR